ncbi:MULTISPECIES: hypothetical protein [unclassified Myroides]|uniref:hypothetical protein n=1 Tax=unclassified Myroides TaxID=2642485 RepID=UPI003D2F633E
MKNKKRAVTILFIAVSILIFIFFSIKNKINSTIDEVYIDRNIINTESKSLDIVKNIYTMPRLSFSYNKPEFLAYKINYASVDINEYNINSSQLINSISININELITISSFDNDYLYYINNKNTLFKINKKKLKTEKIKDSVYNAFPINKEQFLIYSTIKKENKYNIGIYKLNLNGELNNIFTNQSDTIYKMENILLYDGYFTQHGNGYFSYTYYNIPKIVLFNSDLT